VRYELRGPLRPVVACHCRQCQKSHGNFAAFTRLPLSDFTLVAEDGLSWYTSSEIARRGFCRRCGSSLFYEPTGSGNICVAAGSIDPPSRLATCRHIFVDSKGDYYEITDGLEQLSAGHGSTKRA
jgi:hypothetical protein